MTVSNGDPVPISTPGIKQVDSRLDERIRFLETWSKYYLLLTFALLAGAIWVYLGAAARAAEDADKLTRAEKPRVIDFHDTATNPGDESVVVVGDESTILVFSENGEVKSNYKHVGGLESDLRSIALSGDGGTAVAAGDDGAILVSRNRGKSWNSARSNTKKDFTDVALSKRGDIAVAVGDRGLIRISHDGGRTWFNPGNITSKHINGIALSDSGTIAVAVADNDAVLVSMDGGLHWSCITGKLGEHCTTENAKRDFDAVAFHGDGATAMAVAAGTDGTILTSCDGGRTWRQHDEVDTKRDLEAVAFSGDGQTAIAVGRRGAVWVTVDLCTSKHWAKRDSKLGDSLEAIALDKDGRIAVAVGRDGAVLVSLDRGVTWNARDSRTAQRLQSVTFSRDGKNVTVAGQDLTILRLSSSSATSDETTLMDTVSIAKESPVKKIKNETTETPKNTDKTSDDEFLKIANLYTIIERIGTVLIVLIMVQYLMSLARYNLRLAAFYRARRDALRLNEMERLPRPENVDELGRMMEALSPDGLDFGSSPKTAVNLAMQLARTIRPDRKTSEGKE